MIKIDLAREISIKTDTKLRDAEKFLDAFMHIVTETLSKEEKVQLAGFGTWEVRQFKSRMGRNPKTGDTLEIPSFNYPAFRPGKHLKDRVAGRESKDDRETQTKENAGNKKKKTSAGKKSAAATIN